jgi:hypothetical protein
MAFDPRSTRAQTAIARTKFLHQGYRANGKILEADMLYTLSLFAIEPIRFVKLFEWREMTEMERCAVGTYWKSLGDALDISYHALPSGETGFRDGIHWLEEISAWSHAYEVQHMKPHPRNKEIADKTIDVLVYNLPDFMKPLGLYFVSHLMDDRLRSAMMYVSELLTKCNADVCLLHQDETTARAFQPIFCLRVQIASVVSSIPSPPTTELHASRCVYRETE